MISKKISLYKIIISIFFGVVGFILNFYTVNAYFHPYKTVFLIGLLFPLLITLSWGWKYGLLSALAGGCQSMWWLWGPSNGYAIFFIVPPFTLWIIWHGLFANLRRKQEKYKWWLNAYVIEIPFRMLSTINLYTLSRWAITFNPPSWGWASGSTNTIPLSFSNFVVVKQCVVGYIILLLADVLLNIEFIRKFFRLKTEIILKNTGYIISVSLLVGVFFWIMDSFCDSLFFYPGLSFLDLLAVNVPVQEIYRRTFFILVCLAGGLLTSKLLYKQHESDKKLVEMIKGSIVPTFVIDREHTVIYWNKACEILSGISADKMVGTKKQWQPFYPVKRPVLADLIVDKATEEDFIKNYSDRYRKSVVINGACESENFFPDLGEKGKWIFFTAAPLKNQQEEIIGAIETLQDITGRKQAEKELRESETKFRLLVEQIPASTYIASLDKSSSTLYVSSHIETLLGISPEKYKKDSDFWVKHLHDEDRERVLGEIRHIHETGQVFISEYRMISTDGRIVWICDEAIIVKDDRGKPLYLLGLMSDITVRKQDEDKLNQTVADLKRSNEYLEQFAYVISHDLKEPLRMVTSYVQLLAKRYKGKLDRNADDFITYAVNGAKRMYSLINDLLIYSRLNRYSKPLEPVDSGNILEQVLANLKIVVEKSGAVITYDALPTVLGDKSQLSEVFQNLIENAIKFNGKEPPQIHISAKKEKNEWVFSVRDNGIGIEPEFFKRIFIIFQRLHTKEEYPGTGIGLALCKKIVESCGGCIWIESKTGKGSVFYFTMPIKGDKQR